MTDGLKPYERTQPSGAQWLGEVPSHWQVVPNRAVFHEVADKESSPERMLSVTIRRGVTPQENLLATGNYRDQSNVNRSGYKLVVPGDLVYNKMRAWQGAFGYSRYRGIVSPAYIVMRPRDGAILSSYAHFLFRTPRFAREAERLSYGIASDMWTLRAGHFKAIQVPLPPRDEQQLIVRFLSGTTRVAERFIEAKQTVIALLNEQKQAIIHQTVTRGLDPSVPMRDSGVPWLGEIPAHWDTKRLGALLVERREVNSELQVSDVLSLTRHRGVIPYAEKGNIGNKKSEDISRYKVVRPDDIVMNSMNVIIGSVGISRFTGCLSPVYYVLKRRREYDCPEYLNAIFQSAPFHKSLVRIGKGILAHRMRIPMELLKAERFPYPEPREQIAIMEFIQRETTAIDLAIDALEREVRLLAEFRDRLTFDVVTGKLDVREVAKALPDPEDTAVAEVDEWTEDHLKEGTGPASS